jgi:hypothetical protein
MHERTAGRRFGFAAAVAIVSLVGSAPLARGQVPSRIPSDGGDTGSSDRYPAATPCDWIPVAEVAAILGELEGTPERVRSAEQPRPMEDGPAWVAVSTVRARSHSQHPGDLR